MQSASSTQHLFFKHSDVGGEDLHVSRVTVSEAISELFTIQVELASTDHDLDPTAFLTGKAHVGIEIASGIHGLAGEVHWYTGVVSEFHRLGRGTTWAHYSATVRPAAYALAVGQRTRVFQEKSIKDLLADFTKGEVVGQVDINLQETYPSREYLVQYQESDWAFLCRLMEHAGISYFFAHSGGEAPSTTLVFCDRKEGFHQLEPRKTIDFKPSAAGADKGGSWEVESVVDSLVETWRMVPGETQVRDYNYRMPDRAPTGGTPVTDSGAGGIHDEFGPHAKDDGEAAKLARIRAEELACRQHGFAGASDEKSFRSGHVFSLDNHGWGDLNQSYLLVRVDHVASQELESGSGGDGTTSYVNRFTAVPASLPFRPPRLTPQPVIPGVVNAKIDSSGSGQYADLDEQGRYRVRLPFDSAEQDAGKGSRPVRMATPYAGADHGFHFPLHKDAEVLVTHVNGDPDRPIISGAVNNPLTPSPVERSNQTQSVIRTAGQNELRFEDQEGSEQVYLKATRDRVTEIANDETKTVGGNQTLTVTKDQTVSVDKNHTSTIKGTKTEVVTLASDERVGAAKTVEIAAAYQISVGAAMNESVIGIKAEEVKEHKYETVKKDRTLTVGKEFTVDVTEGYQETTGKDRKVKAKTITLEAEDTITIKVGKAKIVMQKSGDITIEGANVNVKGTGNLILKGAKIASN